MRRWSILPILLFVFLFLPMQAQTANEPATPEALSLKNQIGGGSYAVVTQGNVVYAAIGPRLAILEPNASGQFHVVGETAPFQDMIHRVAVSGAYAYLAEYSSIGWNHDAGKIHIVDVSHPDSPQVVKTINGILARDMVIQDSYLFIAAQDGLHIFDISQSPKLQKVGYADTPGSTILVRENKAYILQWNGQLLILDVSNPAHPMQLSRVSWGLRQAWDMTFSFPYLNVANGRYGVTVLNVADPERPIKITTESIRGDSVAITQLNNHVFVAANGKLYTFIQDSQGQLQQIADSQKLPATTHQMLVQQNHLFAAAGGPDWAEGHPYGGIFIVDITTPASPQIQQIINIVAHAQAIAWKDDENAYVAGADGLYILVVTDAMTLTQQSFFPTHPTADIDIQQRSTNTYAFLAQRWYGLEIVDVTHPDSLTSLAHHTLDPADGVYCVIVEENLAFLGVSYSKTALVILDVSNPEHPQKLSSFFQQSGRIVHIEKQGQFIYLVTDNTLSVIDISNPAAPQKKGELVLNDGTEFYEIAVEGSYAYIATSDRGVRVIDISNPETPRLETSISVPAFANHIQVSDGLLITSHFMEGTMQGRLYLTNVSDIQHPINLGYVDTVGEPYQAAIRQNQMMVPDGQGGVSLYRSVLLSHSLFLPYISH